MRMTQSTQWIRDFVDWCQWNHLLINNEKTKEPVMDFHRRRSTTPTPVEIQRTGIEILDSYKYLSVHLNKKLDWSHNTDALYRKGQSRPAEETEMFSDSVADSGIFYSVVYLNSSLSKAKRKQLDKLIRPALS